MATGDSTDILERVKKVIPRRWFAWIAPIFAAAFGGVSDQFAWGYAWIVYTRQQSRVATSTGIFLDIIAFDFLGRFLGRKGAADGAFRAQIIATILKERVTRAGMANALGILTGSAPDIFEPWNTLDTGAYGVPGTLAYGQAGGWGSMVLPGQVFIKVRHGVGVPIQNVGGYGNYPGGYSRGSEEYSSPAQIFAATDTGQIENMIVTTKPTGVIVWVQIL